jgi:hypothetical protein
VEEDSDCVTLFLFLALSTLVEFGLVEFPDDFEIPEFKGLVTDCLFFVTFVETGDAKVSFIVADFLRCTVGLTP